MRWPKKNEPGLTVEDGPLDAKPGDAKSESAGAVRGKIECVDFGFHYFAAIVGQLLRVPIV